MARPHLRLNEGRWTLWRLSDEEFTNFVHNSVRITQNYTVVLRLGHRPLSNGRRMGLGQARIVLERRFGVSSLAYDGYRGSWCFPLLLTFDHAPLLRYMVRVHDRRGTIYFPLFRVMERELSPSARTRHHSPFANEFSRSEITAFTTVFFEYLRAGAETLSDSFVAPFCRAVDSDLLLYGCENGLFFEQYYEDRAAFASAREELELRLGCHRAQALLARDRWTMNGALDT